MSKGNGKPTERPGDPMLELAAEVRRGEEWEESTVRTLVVQHQHEPPKTSGTDGLTEVARAAVAKLPPSHLLIVAVVIALAAAAIFGRKLGVC